MFPCKYCKGTGKTERDTNTGCMTCLGSGNYGNSGYTCPTCHGVGTRTVRTEQSCTWCLGTGRDRAAEQRHADAQKRQARQEREQQKKREREQAKALKKQQAKQQKQQQKAAKAGTSPAQSEEDTDLFVFYPKVFVVLWLVLTIWFHVEGLFDSFGQNVLTALFLGAAGSYLTRLFLGILGLAAVLAVIYLLFWLSENG